MNKKVTFLSESSNLLFFWFIGIVFFFFFRAYFIFFYSSDLSSTLNFTDYFNAFFMGFRYDITVISYFLIIPLLASYLLIPLRKEKITVLIRKIFQYLFIISSVVISIITLNYYEEYKDQFNHFLFMGLYDDQKAVLQTIISDYHPFKNGLIILILIFILVKIFNKYENREKIHSFLNSFDFKFKSISFKILIFILFLGSIRGSFTEYPVRRFYTAVTSDTFINKTIINPFRSLSYAISDYNEINKTYGKNPFGEISKNFKNKYSLISDFLKKETKSNDAIEQIPNHIFLVVMESYDSWPLMDKYRSLRISTELKKIEEKGISFKNFLPASSTTMNSFGTIITSIPYSGVNISKIGALKSFPSSIFNQFKKLGYETNFFYGGYLSWQNIDNFVKKQGAENVYGAVNSIAKKGIWGIDDEALYNMTLQKINPSKKSLNIILTMSYHTPYEVDIYKNGFPIKRVSDLPIDIQSKYNEEQTPLKVLGHLWYADKTLGAFVKKAEKKYSNSLFLFTGDHFGRKFINSKPTLYESSSVPFIIYGKYLNKNFFNEKKPGSHKDISATLYNLVAEDKSTYYSFGNSLTKLNKSFGFSDNKIITKNNITEFTKNYGTKTFKINNKTSNKTDFKKKLDSVLSLAWHYIVKGDSIK